MSSGHTEAFLHLVRDYTEPIRDPLWKHIYVSRELKDLISLPPFQKLGRIKQLGPAYLVYPGAVHTRLNHSLGVLHLARKLLLALLDREGLDFITVEGVKCFLAAALFHDLGHFPFAHSLKELPLRSHEALGAEGLTEEPIASAIRTELKCPPERVAAIIDEERDAAGDEEVHYFRRLLSGVLDPDKLDYLNRDAYFCGVPYGMQDTEYIFHKVRLHRNMGIALESDGLTAVENILFSKYLMYRTVYWHRVVRIATAMIKQPLNMAMADGSLDPSALYWLDDEEFFGRFSSKRKDPFELITKVFFRDLFKTAHEVPFPEGRHGRLLDLEVRLSESERIASKLSMMKNRDVAPWEVIIDIPEPISFEIELPIVREERTVPFAGSGSVFSGPVVEGFTSSMRMLRVFVPEDLAEADIPWEELLP